MWVNQHGVTQLLLKSELPIAKQIYRRVCSEVLPSIQNTETYSLPNAQVHNQSPNKELEDALVQAQIECCREDLISKRLANRHALLTLTLEAKGAIDFFGQDSINEVKEAGREAIRIACLPPGKSDSQTTSLEYLRMKGLSEEAISHVGSTFGKLVQDVYTRANAGCTPDKNFELITIEEGAQKIRRPLNIYNSQLDRAVLDRSFHMLSFHNCYRAWVA